MGKSHPDPSKLPRQRPRQLSIIYFVDAARTRTITIPLGRLRLMAGGAVGLGLWSVGSVFLTAHFLGEQAQLEGRLRTALSSIFDYETRDEQVFDVAYPQPAPAVAMTGNGGKKMAGKPAGAAGHLAASGPSAPAAGPSAATASSPTGVSSALPPSPAAASALAATTATLPAAATTTTPGLQVEVAMGKAQFERTATGLDLQVELTNKSKASRVEGYIYAVAEFVSDQGEQQFISWPAEMKLDSAGAATNPHKAALFGIKRFKDRRFNFTVADGKKGRFTKVRVVLLGRVGSSRSTIELPVPAMSTPPAEQSRATKTGAPKPG